MARAVVIAAWLWGIASFFVAPDSGVSAIGRIVFWILLVVHAIECVVFLPKFRRAGGSLARHLAQTFVFGVVYAGGIRDEGSAEG